MRRKGVSQEQAEFAEFYARSRDDCLRTVLATVRDVDKAQDLVAEAFARAWASWGRVSRHPAPRAWVVRTALNLSVSSWRRHRRELPLMDHDARAGCPASLGRQGQLPPWRWRWRLSFPAVAGPRRRAAARGRSGWRPGRL